MNSHRPASLLGVLLLLAFSNTFQTTLAYSSSNKVSLALYYETLCPYCAKFIVNHLNKLVHDDEMMKIVDLRFVPYGNAKISNGTVICQHGDWECALNKVEACAIDVFPSLSQYFPFIHCVETFAEKGQETKWTKCFDKQQMDPRPVSDCYTSGRGDELIFKYAEETESLQPPHKYVPWVTVNGSPLYEDYENFIAYICKAYKGTNPPKACTGRLPLESDQIVSTGQNTDLKSCAREETPKPAIPSRI